MLSDTRHNVAEDLLNTAASYIRVDLGVDSGYHANSINFVVRPYTRQANYTILTLDHR